MIRSEIEFRLGKPILTAKPYAIKIETTVLCNLRCPGCFRTQSAQDITRDRFMSFEQYQKIIDPLAPYLLEISMYDQGEPLIQPNIFQFLKFNARRNIGTILSSNFAMNLPDEKLTNIITSGLDYLIVAIDGTTQETYEKYRVGGRLEKVLSNLRRLIALKKKLKTTRPLVEWQMVDFAWNRHQQPKAQKMASAIGCDFFNVVVNGYTLNRNKNYRRQKRCPVLWNTLTIEFDGRVSACYVNDDKTLYVGDFTKQGPWAIWNSKAYQFLRRTHNNQEKGANFSFCNRCEMFDQ